MITKEKSIQHILNVFKMFLKGVFAIISVLSLINIVDDYKFITIHYNFMKVLSLYNSFTDEVYNFLFKWIELDWKFIAFKIDNGIEKHYSIIAFIFCLALFKSIGKVVVEDSIYFNKIANKNAEYTYYNNKYKKINGLVRLSMVYILTMIAGVIFIYIPLFICSSFLGIIISVIILVFMLSGSISKQPEKITKDTIKKLYIHEFRKVLIGFIVFLSANEFLNLIPTVQRLFKSLGL